MTDKTAKRVFFAGTLSSAILFLALTWDTHSQIGALTNADQLSSEVVAGKKVFEKYNCNDCHTMLGFGGYYAPDLTKVYQRKGEQYIRAVVAQPEKVLVKSFRKMPQQNLGAAQIDSLVAFFKWTGEIDTHDWPPQDSKKRRPAGVDRLVGAATVSPGAALFKEHGCFSCHKLQGTGGDIGPALDDVGTRLSVGAIKKYISDPKAFQPDTVMPAYSGLADEDLQAMAEFLSRQGGQQ